MKIDLLAIAAQLSDDALLAKVKLLAACSREVTVELIAHLAEMDVRKLHCAEGAGSLFRSAARSSGSPKPLLSTASKPPAPRGNSP